MTKGESPRGRHLIITRKASILIITIITILTILICQSLWRRRGRSGETTKASLSSYYTTDTGVHLTQLIRESVKASIHALKLRYDSLESHITSQGRRIGGGRNNRSCRIGSLYKWPLRSKLGLTSSNKTGINGTHGGKVRRIRNGDGKMAKDSHDSQRNDELIMGHRILIDINYRSDKMRREVNGKIL